MKHKILIAVDQYIMAQDGCHAIPFKWYEEHDQAFMRDDGLIYIGGFRTKEKAEAWAKKNNIM